MSYGGFTKEIGVPIVRRTPAFDSIAPRYVVGGLGANKAYWDARAKACQEFADEGECLARVARHVPVTIGSYSSLGNTSQNLRTTLDVTAGLFRDPDGTLRQYGPPIVAAADDHVVDPLLGRVGKALVPYVLKYVLPVIAGLYITTGIAAYYSYKTYTGRRGMKTNRRRRRRTSRR